MRHVLQTINELETFKQSLRVRYHPMFSSDTGTDLETTYPTGIGDRVGEGREGIGKYIPIALAPLRIECHIFRISMDTAQAIARYVAPPLFGRCVYTIMYLIGGAQGF